MDSGGEDGIKKYVRGNSKILRQNIRLFSFGKWEGRKAPEKGGRYMDENNIKTPTEPVNDAELADTLIAVSVVSKRLAERLRTKKEPSVDTQTEGDSNGG